MIHEGRVVALDDKSRLIERMSQDTIEITLNRRLDMLPAEFLKLGVEMTEDSNTITLRNKDGELSALLKAVHRLEMDVVNVHVKKTTLEDVFRKLTWGEHEPLHRF